MGPWISRHVGWKDGEERIRRHFEIEKYKIQQGSLSQHLNDLANMHGMRERERERERERDEGSGCAN